MNGASMVALEAVFGVELHFEKGNKKANRTLLKEIEKLKDEIEKETGEKVIIQEDWGKTWARLYIEKDEGEMTDELKKWAGREDENIL